jgi:hypothetical protein
MAGSKGRIAGLLLAAVLAGCGDGAPVAEAIENVAAVVTDTTAEAAKEEQASRPAEIYYDLTAYDWYRQGEPLVVDGRVYQLHGAPAAVPASEMTRAGEYGGVAYYAHKADPAGAHALYVPVSEGYWQPFAPADDGARAAD